VSPARGSASASSGAARILLACAGGGAYRWDRTGKQWTPLTDAGAAVSLGFTGSRSGTNGGPTAFTLNGSACTVTQNRRPFAEDRAHPVVRQHGCTVADGHRRGRGKALNDIQYVGVVGCGLMGAGIAEVCARSGLDVKVAETTGEALELGRSRLTNSLGKAAERGKISEADRDSTLARLSFTTDLGEFADRDLVIEAVVENEQVKTEIFQVLDQVVTRPDAILASNTSSIPLVKLAVATSRPGQVLGIHFFNPAPVQQLVELIPALTTGDQTLLRAEKLVTDVLGKHAIRAQDRSGFVVNALLIPYLLSSIRMFESGIASREDIDNGMELGCAHPMGPLKLSDLIGLDTVASVAFSMYEEYKEPLYAAPPLLLRMVDAGRLGRKSGHGFYDYS
jgi:3-hydroxybutyryl-CoA dehydrogenase